MAKKGKKRSSEKSANLLKIATKRRQLHLLERLRAGETLKPSEIRELEGLEAKVSGPSKSKDLPPGVVSTKTQLGMAIGKSVRTITYWMAEGMPVNPDQTYHIANIVEWYVTRNIKKEAGKTTVAEDQLREIKAQKAEFELQQMKGDLVNRSEVEHQEIQKIASLKIALLTLPKRISTRVVGLKEGEVFIVINNEIKKMIQVFAGEPTK